MEDELYIIVWMPNYMIQKEFNFATARQPFNRGKNNIKHIKRKTIPAITISQNLKKKSILILVYVIFISMIFKKNKNKKKLAKTIQLKSQ